MAFTNQDSATAMSPEPSTILALVIGAVTIGAVISSAVLLARRFRRGRIAATIHPVEAVENSPDELLALLQKESENRRNRRRGITWGFGVMAALLLGLVGTYTALSIYHGDWGRHVSLIKDLGPFGSFAAFAGIAFAATQAHKQALQSAATFNDVRFVGPLAEALWLDDSGIRAVAEGALISLLPQMSPEDGRTLTPDERGALYRALASKNVELVKAALVALEQIGDGSALARVEKLAERNNALRDDALRLIPVLQSRAENERAAQVLLRPTSTEEEPTLLRPAAPTGAEDPALLLRSATGPQAG